MCPSAVQARFRLRHVYRPLALAFFLQLFHLLSLFLKELLDVCFTQIGSVFVFQEKQKVSSRVVRENEPVGGRRVSISVYLIFF